MKDFKVTL